MAALPNSEPELIALAASGNRDAQLSMAYVCLAHAMQGVPAMEALAGAEAFARMAVNHDAADLRPALVLADVLLSKAAHLVDYEPIRSETLRGEAYALFDYVADHGDSHDRHMLAAALDDRADKGDEAAAQRLNRLIDSLSDSEADALRTAAKRSQAEDRAFCAKLANIIER
jgi:hypothetical protein